MRIALAQINTIVGDLAGNSQKILEQISRAQKQDADIVVFPELAVTGYPPEDLLYKESFVMDNIQTLKNLVKKVTGITAVIGFVDVDKNKKIYNAAAVVSDRRLKGIYRKEALPNYGVFDEKRYFTEGKNNPLFRFGNAVVGINICEDIWQEDGSHRWQAKAGAKILINLSSSPYDLEKLEGRRKLLSARAKQYKAFICYVNLVGGQDELVFDGGSMVVNPQGKNIAFGKQFETDLLVVDLDLPGRRGKTNFRKLIPLSGSAESKNKIPLKVQLAAPLSQNEGIYRALVMGTRDYVQKNGFKKVLIGLSGGIDSSLVAAIAREAIGEENVIGVSMPSRFTSIWTKSDARQLAENLGIRFIEIPIEEIFKSYLGTLSGEFKDQKFNIAEENLQARIRGNILMAFSNKFDWLVLTTGNKSEVAVGYCTLYGDMSGGFAVIKDLPKTKVYEISRLINKREAGLIPESVFTRAPTAELRENQTDQDTLPAYDFLDLVLKAYVEDHQSLASMGKKFEKTPVIQDIIRMVDRSEYKRRQAPPGIKITPRAFGKDWRLPITNKYRPSS